LSTVRRGTFQTGAVGDSTPLVNTSMPGPPDPPSRLSSRSVPINLPRNNRLSVTDASYPGWRYKLRT